MRVVFGGEVGGVVVVGSGDNDDNEDVENGHV